MTNDTSLESSYSLLLNFFCKKNANLQKFNFYGKIRYVVNMLANKMSEKQ